MALLLIDGRTLDIPFILRCLESNVTPVIFDFERETFESLTEKIPQQRYTHLGILQDNRNSNTYSMIASFGESIIHNVAVADPRLETWTSFHLFIELCVSSLGVSCLDLIECNLTKDWDYLSQQWNIPIRYSSKPIGRTYWSLNQGVSLIGLYFTTEIKTYPHMLGEAALTQISLLDYRGQVYLFGLETEMVTVPTFISTEITTPYARDVSTGSQNTIITLNDKTVYGYGKDNGEMGLTLNTVYTVPTLIPISNVTMTSQGEQFGLYLKANGDVYGTGKNTYGNLGINSTVDQYGVFVQCSVSNIISIHCAPTYACFLDNQRNVYVCGKDEGFGTGDLMTPTLLQPQIIRVATGDKHLALLYPNGTVFCRGVNTYGQLGNGTNTSSVTPVQVYTEYGSPLTNVIYLDANLDMCLAIDSTMRLWVWGNAFDNLTTRVRATLADTNVEWAKIFKTGILTVKNNIYSILYGSLALFPSSSGLLLYPNGTAISYDTTVGANICFPMGTPIVTDQGIVPIDRIVPREHTLHGREIVAITHTYSLDQELVCFEKDSLRKNYPSQQTVMSRLHQVYYKGSMKAAYHFVGKKGVYAIPYEKQILYNVLMKEPETMNVNGLICETLNPANPICKLFM